PHGEDRADPEGGAGRAL
ncbi:hypothetical protein J1605_005016, partial [Eschrichtius robustus]